MKLLYTFLSSEIKRNGTAEETDSFPNFFMLLANVLSAASITISAAE